MNIYKKLEKFVAKVFKTTLEVFLEALKLSPNAQGYVSGSVTELLLKNHLTSLGFQVLRIREKWEGRKHPNHHGDFYFKDKQDNWYVLESKGVKSNSEKWHKLYNYINLKRFMFDHSDKINWLDRDLEFEPQIDNWLQINLPKFFNEYEEILYDYEEIIKYSPPKKETLKSIAILKLKNYSRDEISRMINERLEYVMKKIKVLETHFVSGTGGQSGRTQATPRKDEFNILSIDIFLRYNEHKFLFANPLNLESSSADADHLQQNYIMGFVFNNCELSIADEWEEDFNLIIDTLNKKYAINQSDMQIDNRNIIYESEI
jgi:hypothetical protein